MTRVLCCYTPRQPRDDGRYHLHSSQPDGLASVRLHAPQAELVDVTGDEYAYWREIRARWQGTEDLIVIEHDIQVGPGTVASLEGCDRAWCCFAYDIFGCKRLDTALGCTRFSAALQRTVSLSKVEDLFSGCASCQGRGCWWHLDNYLATVLLRDGFSPHVHGDVAHLHDYGAPGTIPLMDGIVAFYSWEQGSEPSQFFLPAV